MHLGTQSRRTVAVAFVVYCCVLMTSFGCYQKEKEPFIARGMVVGDYTFDFEMGQPSSIESSGKLLIIESGPRRIEVFEGRLKVDNNLYGDVKPGDSISVLKGEVKVNGEVRTPRV